MRDPKRISKIMNLIKEIWRRNPDLRLCQLILNVKKPDEDDLYYLEDDALFERLSKLYSADNDEVEEFLQQFRG